MNRISFQLSRATKMMFVTVLGLGLGVTACSSGSGAADPGDGGPSDSGPGGTDPIVGKSCTTDGDCGAGYSCDGATPGPGPTPGPGCTPDRSCTALECKDICLAMGQIDPSTGEPMQACLDDCAVNAKCCSGSGGGGGGGGGGTPGKCAKKPGSTPTDSGTPPTDTGTPPTDTGTTPTPMNWDGTWSVTVEYDVACDVGFGTIKKGHNKHTLSMAIDGAATALSATPKTPDSGWTPMTGSGDDSGMTLSGEFPFEDDAAAIVSSTENTTTLKITTVSGPKAASGSFEGSGKGQFGAKCKVTGGTASLSR